MTKNEERGALAEERFIRVMNEHREIYSPWFMGVVRASRKLDQRGIDAIAYALSAKEDQILLLPIQVKSSRLRLNHFKTIHETKSVALVLVKDAFSDDQIRKHSLRALSSMRNDQIDYLFVLARIAEMPLTGNALLYYQQEPEKGADPFPPSTQEVFAALLGGWKIHTYDPERRQMKLRIWHSEGTYSEKSLTA